MANDVPARHVFAECTDRSQNVGIKFARSALLQSQGYPLRGIILDTETTGLDSRKDEIGNVTGVYGGLQQPSIPIPANVTRLTGITDAMVLGQMIDMPAVRALIEPEDPIIAHNPGFDRPFCEAFSHFSPQGLGLLEF